MIIYKSKKQKNFFATNNNLIGLKIPGDRFKVVSNMKEKELMRGENDIFKFNIIIRNGLVVLNVEHFLACFSFTDYHL
jgi:hypothetical protein